MYYFASIFILVLSSCGECSFKMGNSSDDSCAFEDEKACKDGRSCVHWSAICDSRYDCPDRSDESFCPGTSQSSLYRGRKIESFAEAAEKVFPRLIECIDTKGEPGLKCSRNETCIPFTIWCNGDTHFAWPCRLVENNNFFLCSNKTFWQNKPCEARKEFFFRCHGRFPGQCQDIIKFCDGNIDCKDASDEICFTSLLERHAAVARDNSYHACNAASAAAIHPKLICDGSLHCPNQSDEDVLDCGFICGYNKPNKADTITCVYRFDPSLQLCSDDFDCDSIELCQDGTIFKTDNMGRIAASYKCGEFESFLAFVYVGFVIGLPVCVSLVFKLIKALNPDVWASNAFHWPPIESTGESDDQRAVEFFGRLLKASKDEDIYDFYELSDFDNVHEAWSRQAEYLLPLCTSLPNQEECESKLVLLGELEGKFHDGRPDEAALCLKNRYGNLYDASETNCIKRLKGGKSALHFARRLLTAKIVKFSLDGLSLISLMYDCAKDFGLAFALYGITVLYNEALDETAQTFDIFVFVAFFVLAVTSLTPSVLIYIYSRVSLDLTGKTDPEELLRAFNEDDPDLIQKYTLFRESAMKVTYADFRRSFHKLHEACTESFWSLTLTFVVGLFLNSETPLLNSDLERSFSKAAFLFSLNVVSSLISISKAVKKYLSLRRKISPKAAAILILYAGLTIGSKILAVVCFFAPYLGLFGLLVHWRNANYISNNVEEMRKYSNVSAPFKDISTFVPFVREACVIPYAAVAIYFALMLTAAILGAQPKLRRAHERFVGFCFIRPILPGILQDFDENRGQWKRRTMIAELVFHSAAHLTLLVPLLMTCRNVSDSHAELVEAGLEVTEEEIRAERKARAFLISLPSFYTLLPVIQLGLLLAYYKKAHQSSNNILFQKKKKKKPKSRRKSSGEEQHEMEVMYNTSSRSSLLKKNRQSFTPVLKERAKSNNRNEEGNSNNNVN